MGDRGAAVPASTGRRPHDSRHPASAEGASAGGTYALDVIRCAALVALLLLPVPGDARATALYAADVTAVLTIRGLFDAAGLAIDKPADLVVDGSAALFDRSVTTSGSATADDPYTALVPVADPLKLQLGEVLYLSARASGSASAPPVSSAELLARTNGRLFVDNRSATTTYRLGFELAVSWALDVSASVPADKASAGSSILRIRSSSAAW